MKGISGLRILAWNLVFAGMILVTGCGGGTGSKVLDTPTTGKIRISIDDSYKLLAEAEIYTFQSMYVNAKIDTTYGTEADVINEFLKDSVPLIIVNRKLTKDEEQRLNAVQSIPRTTKIAYDALALIVNNENPDSNIHYDRVADIFKGKIGRWNQVDPKSKLADIKVVFDNYKSGNPRYFREKFNLTKLPDNCFAVDNNEQVLRFVEKNKNAIGIISVNWISDRADTVSQHFLKNVKVVGLSTEGNNDPNATFYQPYQAYIADGSYPFTREVYCINRQPYTGLAYGFSSFLAGQQGQLIVLHSGLVPAALPVRLVEIKH
jgi:phosphate transport system substrate-binding protein